MISRYGRPCVYSSPVPGALFLGLALGGRPARERARGSAVLGIIFCGVRAGSSMGGAWRGRRDRPAKLPVRVTPWRHEGDSVGAGSGLRSHRNCMQIDSHLQARQRRGTTREPVQYCGALTMARAHELSEESNADELENRTLIDQMLSKTKIRPTVLPR
jgi:hypothetical protein